MLKNEKLSSSEELFKLYSGLSSNALSLEGKQNNLKQINDKFTKSKNNLAGGGNFISLQSTDKDVSSLKLPQLECGLFRKGYTLIAWICPNEGIQNLDDTNNNGILYRLSFGDKFGVIATLKQLKHDPEASTLSCQIQVQTFAAHPTHNSSSSANSFPTHTTPVDFTLPTDTFSLLTISHTHPYLKNPQITITINHKIQLHKDLSYPFSNQNVSTKSNLPEHNLFLTNNLLFKNVPISCSVLSVFKEPLVKDQSDYVLPNMISEAGPSAAILLFKAGILVPPIPPQRDAIIQPFSNTSSPSSFYPSSSSSSYSRRNHLASNIPHRSLGSSISVHPKSIDLQNYLSRSLVVLYDFETVQRLTQDEKKFSPPCLVKNVGCVEDVGWITNLTMQRNDSAQIYSNMNGGGIGSYNQYSSFSVQIIGSNATHIYRSPSSTDSLSGTTRYPRQCLSKSDSTLLYTSGLLSSFLLPFHLALFPQEEQRHCAQNKDDNVKASTPMQPILQSQRKGHLNDLLANQGQYAMDLLLGFANVLEVSWFCREEALQTGLIYDIATYSANLLEALNDDSSISSIDKETILGKIELGLLRIVEECCGKLESDNPVKRSSDLALSCVFGLALNFRLLTYFSASTSSDSNRIMRERRNLILEHIVALYQFDGDTLREYFSPQTLLDQIQIYFPSLSCEVSSTLSTQFELLLKVLIQSSLSSTTNIARSEIDVQACIQALTNTNLGSLVSRMVLRALNGLKSRRLARNLWIGDYPKVIGPVLLSRSVMAGDDGGSNDIEGSNEWRQEWRFAFELYVWLTSIPGSEGQLNFKTFGDLLIESGKAGSLERCVDEEFARRLFEMEEYDTKLLLPPEEQRLDDEFLSETRAQRVRALLPLLPGLVISLVAPNHSHHPKTPKHHIVPVLNTLFGGVALALKQLTESSSIHQNSLPASNTFFIPDNHQTNQDFGMINHIKTMEWIPILNSVVDLLVTYEVDNHTDWIDVEHSNEDVQAKEFQITSCVDLILDSISTLLISSMRIGGKTTVAALQKIKSCSQITRILHMTLNRCIHIGSKSFTGPMSAGVARLCVFLEEHQNLKWEEKLNWTLIEILRRGRESSGWYQVTNKTVPLPPIENQGEKINEEKASLRSKLSQFVDENLIQTSSDIYHSLTDESILPPSFKYEGSLLLPILQPTLRIVLQNLSKITSNMEFAPNKTLLQHASEEINLSVTAALVGMSFSNARDIGLGCIASLRSSINAHKSTNDSMAVSIIEDLVVKITKELHERIVIEKRSRHATQYSAYEDGNGREDGQNSKMVEQLILGHDALSEEHQDFILYPESLRSNDADTKRNSKTVLGWSKYSGLGNVLEECFESEEEVNAIIILDKLSSFLDGWDAAVEMEKSDMINLFDGVNDDMSETNKIKLIDGAGDAAAQYIELSSAEKLRLQEVEKIFSSLAYQCESSASKLCWERWMENIDFEEKASLEWERCIGDRGGRDVYSRLGTCWITPQFPRFIPDYLDNSKTNSDMEVVTDLFDAEFNLGGQVEIVDITKKNYFEDDSHNSEDEGSLGFPDVSDSKKLDDEPISQDIVNDVNAEVSRKSPYNKMSHMEPSPFATTNVHTRTVLSSFTLPPDITAPYQTTVTSSSQIEKYCDNILHVRPEGSRKGVLLITKTHLIIEYYHQYYESEVMAMEETKNKIKNDENIKCDEDEISEFTKSINTFGRTNSCRFLISEITQAYLRRYRLRDSAVEIFFLASGGSSSFSSSNSLFIDFGPGSEGNSRRDLNATYIMRCAPQNSLKQFPEKSNRFLQEQLQKITVAWVQGSLSNFDYLMQLNILSGRSFNDLCQYPVMPWVLSNYHSTEIPDLNDPENFRDMTKPMGALNAKRLAEFVERFETFSDPTIPPFMYGSHYSTNAGVVLHFLVRLHPFAGLHRQLQGGHFDVADRLFCNIQRTWETCTGASVSEVKELTPEWYCNPAFLKNSNNFEFGTSQEGELIDDVKLPPWATGSPEKFVEVMRCAMESNICTVMLPDWVDLIFGFKQQGPAAVKAKNVFFYLTYYGSVDISAIKDDDLRISTELQIAHFGQCPMQLFWKPHVRKYPLIDSRRKDCMSVHLNLWSQPSHHENPSLFRNSPINHWVHLGAPPPGPHGDLVCVRACLGNRCVGVDDRGVLHFFRWAWKAEDNDVENEDEGKLRSQEPDRGCFVAQRELSNFRSLPRLPLQRNGNEPPVAVAISRQLYLMSSHLLVLSDGDGCGGLGLQYVDPKKGLIKTETVLPFIHSSRITAIDMDSIGQSGGRHSKGPSGEVAIVGSEDGTATLWRFIFNSHIPLRPRLRMRGHYGQKIRGVAINCFLNLCATVSKSRCCLFHLGNGTLVRSFTPPTRDDGSELFFVDTNALCFSIQGYVVLICQSFRNKKIFYSLELFTLEGNHCGSRILESVRGIPRKLIPFADGKAVCVCGGIGISTHRISSIQPLELLEEWQITNPEVLTNNVWKARKIQGICDIDFYPSVQSIGPPYDARPCIAVAGCSNGSLRIHALAGITRWCAENQVSSVSSVVGNALVKPANTIKTAVGSVRGLGTRVIGFGKEIGREVGGVISPGAVVSAGGALVGGLLRNKKASRS